MQWICIDETQRERQLKLETKNIKLQTSKKHVLQTQNTYRNLSPKPQPPLSQTKSKPPLGA
jgi:hypothetical protein